MRKLDNFTPITARTRGTGKEAVTTHSPPVEQYREAARLCLQQGTQAGIGKGGLEGLTAETRTCGVEGFAEKKILTLGGPAEELLESGVRQGRSAYSARHPLSRLYLDGHKMDHAGVDAMVMRSRSQVWITRVRPKGGAVKRACFTCKRSAKRLGEQKMAPILEHRIGPTPPFYSTAIGPVRSPVHQRVRE